jgi:hypothetical protein
MVRRPRGRALRREAWSPTSLIEGPGLDRSTKASEALPLTTTAAVTRDRWFSSTPAARRRRALARARWREQQGVRLPTKADCATGKRLVGCRSRCVSVSLAVVRRATVPFLKRTSRAACSFSTKSTLACPGATGHGWPQRGSRIAIPWPPWLSCVGAFARTADRLIVWEIDSNTRPERATGGERRVRSLAKNRVLPVPPLPYDTCVRLSPHARTVTGRASDGQ